MKKILNVFLCCILILTSVLGNVTVVNAATLENVALGKTAVASDIEKSTRPASNAVDGKTSTHWAGLSHTSWLYVDLGGVYEVDSVNVLTYPSGSRYYNYEVLGTLDGATWTKIGEKTDTTAETSSGTTFEAGNEKYCCVKIQFLYNSDNSKVHMKELRVYGTEVADEESYLVFQFNMAKAELSELVEECEAEYEVFDYTEETWSIYETALNTAKELLENTEGTAGDVESAMVSLQEAAEGLVYQVYENPEGTYRFASTNLYAMGTGGIDVDGMLTKFYNRYAVDYAGLQEVDRNTTRNPFDTMEELTTDTRFVDYAFNKNITYQGGEYGIGIVSTTEIKETTSGLYTKLGSEEQRGWVRTVIELDGKEVAFYNTHLSTSAKPIVSNMAEIIQIMDEDPLEYKILTADFNCNREWMYPFLVNYNLLNGKDGAWYQTHGGYIDTPFSTANGIDNIITSRNIEVVDFQVVDSLGLSDHNFIYADLKLLDKEVPSKEYLNIEVTDAKKLEAADYTEETWVAVEAALADAEALTDEASQEEINAVLFALQDGVKNLVRIYPLISEGKVVTVDGEITSGAAGNINDGDVYTTLKTPFFTDMIIDLDELCRIDEIQVFPYGKSPCCYYYTLYTSIDGVNYEYFGEKTSDEIASIKTGDVFEKENCMARYVKIQTTSSSDESSSYGVLGELEVYGAVAEDADDFKTALGQLIHNYRQLNGEEYLSNSFEQFQTELENAEAEYSREDLTKEEAEAAYTALLEAYDSLEPVPDKTELLALIETAEAKDLSTYSERTVNNFLEKLQYAKSVYSDENSRQSLVDEAYEKLNTAISMLKVPTNVAYKMELVSTDNTVMVTLDGLYHIDEIIVFTDYADGVSYNYDVYVSEDGENWIKAAEQTGDVVATADGYVHEIDNTLTVKYIKLESSEALTVTSIYAYGEESNNIVLGKPVTVGNATRNISMLDANDGKKASYWEAGKYESLPWMVFDLEGLYKLDSINVVTYWSRADRYYNYNVYVSTDGEEYTLYATRDNMDITTVYGDTFEAEGEVYASYIKVEGTYNSSNTIFHLNEVRAYGELVSEDKSMLSNAVAKAEAFDEAIYVESGWIALEEAVAAAKEILADDKALQQEVDEALETLNAAVGALEYKPADYTAVDEALAKVPADMNNYTEETVEAVNAAVAAVVRGKNITEQAEVDAMAKAIEDAVAALKYKDADYSAVDAALEKVPEDLSVYTEETVEAVNTAVAAVVRGKNITEQAEVDAMAKAIEDAVAALTEIPVEKPEPITADHMTLTASSVDETEPAHNKDPENVLDNTNTTFWATVPTATLADAWLQVELDQTYEISWVDYTKRYDSGAIWNCTGNLLDYIIEVSMDGTNWTQAAAGDTVDGTTEITFEPVKAKYVRLRATESYHWQEASANTVMTVADLAIYGTAVEEPEKPVDKTALEALIEETKAMDVSGYTEESVLQLLLTLTQVQAIADKEDATQEEVDAAIVTLQSAIESLEEVEIIVPVDKTALNAAIDETLALDPYEYVDFTAVREALWNAQDVAENVDVTQAEVDAAAKALNDAVAALEEKPVEPPVVEKADKEALAATIAAAEALNAEDYTEESWATATAALAEAKEVYNKEDATQEEVDAAADRLNDAVAALQEKPVDPPAVEEDEVARISGKTRYETGYKVADALKEELGVDKFEAVVVATGKNFADALAGSYLAVEKNAPILLTNGNDDNVAMLHEYITANVAAGGKVYILGGEGAVPAAVAAIDGYDVVRLSGKSRYETNLAILAEAGIEGTELIVATGKTFADSLSASAAKLPILLVKPGAALSDEAKVIAEGRSKFYIIGGEGAVSADIAAELAAYGEVVRVSGKTRYETSVAVANTFFTDVEEAVVASGKNFPDGLCGGPLAAAMNAPLILTADSKTDAAADYMVDNVIASGYVLGGAGALADDSVVDVFSLESAEEIVLK